MMTDIGKRISSTGRTAFIFERSAIVDNAIFKSIEPTRGNYDEPQCDCFICCTGRSAKLVGIAFARLIDGIHFSRASLHQLFYLIPTVNDWRILIFRLASNQKRQFLAGSFGAWHGKLDPTGFERKSAIAITSATGRYTVNCVDSWGWYYLFVLA